MTRVSPVVGDGVGGGDERDGAGRGRLPQAGPDLARRSALQGGPEHVAGTPQHRGSRVDVLRGGVLHEPVGGEHDAATSVHVLLAGDALDATEVVGVAVAVDDADHGSIAAMLPVERERRCGGFRGDERIDDEHAGLALDERDVREVEAAHLVDAGNDLEQAVDRVQLRLAPEAGVGGFRHRALEEGAVGLVVPDHTAVGIVDDARVDPPDEAASSVVEVLGVVERQLGEQPSRWLT